MKRPLLIFFVFFGCFAAPQEPPLIPTNPGREPDVKLPNGRSQRDEIVKADHKKNLEEAADLARLADELKADLEKDDKYVVSIKNLKKTEEIEKLARSIRSRLKRY
jgi:hypothetical protein